MHELPVIESMMAVVLRHAEANSVKKVVGIGLRIGELSDLADEWMERYFSYVSRGTVAEGAVLRIERAPIVLQCNICEKTFRITASQIGDAVCPSCRDDSVSLVSGREFHIKQIEVI